MTLTATWHGTGRPPTQPPNPIFPHGMMIDVAGPSVVSCKGELPYPAPHVGQWVVKCDICGHTAIITAAGRVDDPRAVRLPCRLAGSA